MSMPMSNRENSGPVGQERRLKSGHKIQYPHAVQHGGDADGNAFAILWGV